MLILSRKCGQTIEVSGPCTIYFKSINGGRIQVGVDAPCTTKVLRGEVVGKQTKQPKPPARQPGPGGGNG